MVDASIDTSNILDALVGMQVALAGIEQRVSGHSFEWQSVQDAVRQVRATLAAIEFLDAVVPPSEQRQLLALLDELSARYHLDSREPIIGPPGERIAQSVRKAIQVFAPNLRPLPGGIGHIPAAAGEAKGAMANDVKKMRGPKVTEKDRKNRKLVVDNWNEFHKEYKQLGYKKASFHNAAKWMVDKKDTMGFLTVGISDATDYDEIGKKIKKMIRAHKETPEPNSGS